MSEQPNSSAADQSTGHDGNTDSMGQAILGLLNAAADKAEADAQHALEASRKLSLLFDPAPYSACFLAARKMRRTLPGLMLA